MVIHKSIKHIKSRNISKHISKNISRDINEKIINILSAVKKYYEKQNNNIRVNAYERAIYQIKHWNKTITKGSELSHLIGIGKGMIEKIDTIIKTGTLPIIKEKGLETYLDTSSEKTKKNITNHANHANTIDTIDTIDILGFGKTKIEEFKAKGARTINNIRKLEEEGKVELNKTQTIGLKYYEDLKTLIPREEITKIGHQIKTIIEKEHFLLKCFLAGSYPSGTKESSKDIDILIVVNDDVTHNLGLYRDILKKISNILPLETISLGNEKFLGLIKSPISGKWRHLDIRITLIDELPYSWLYYTGGKIFNKLIRERLKKKGYKLNEYGLYKNNIAIDLDNKELDKFGTNDDGMVKINEKQMMDYTEYIEKKIFAIADMEYKSVRERY